MSIGLAPGVSSAGFCRSERRSGRIRAQIEADERLCRAHRLDQRADAHDEVAVNMELQQYRRMICRSPAARPGQTRGRQDQAHRQKHRSPAPDRLGQSSHSAARETTCLACALPPRQNATSDPAAKGRETHTTAAVFTRSGPGAVMARYEVRFYLTSRIRTELTSMVSQYAVPSAPAY